MKALRLYFGFALLACLFFTIASAEQIQLPLVVESEPAVEFVPEPVVADDAQDTEEPLPPPIWTLCGNPSKHLLIPYLSFIVSLCHRLFC
jgi:hypothetical protein